MPQIRRYKDILAFENAEHEYLAFQGNAMEVAEISQEMWNSMSVYSLNDNAVPEQLLPTTTPAVLSELENWNSETTEGSFQSPKSRKIQGISLNVNQICNLKCSYCYAGGDGTFGEPVKNISIEKTLPQLKFFMDRLSEGSTFSIKFIGGEPLLYTDGILAVAEYVSQYAPQKNLKSQFSIVTNGTQITERNLKALTSIKAHVTVSCDGPPHIQDQFRKTKTGEGSSRSLKQGLEALCAHKSDLGSLQVSGVFGTHNMHLVEAYQFYSEYPVDFYKFAIDFTENGDEFNKVFKAQFTQILDMAYKKGGEVELRKITDVNHYFTQMDEQSKVIHHCGAGVSSIAIDAKNKIYPCPMMVADSRRVLVFDENLIKTLESSYKENLIEQNSCEDCWARYMCGGGCMFVNSNASGDLHKKSSNFCERTRFMILTTLSYYAKIRGEQNTNEGEIHETH